MISTGLNDHFWGVSHGVLSIKHTRMDMDI